MLGNEMVMSERRIIRESVLYPRKPAVDPRSVPIRQTDSTRVRGTFNEILAPYRMRENKSLPNLSVPKTCSEEGAFRLSYIDRSKGSKGASKGTDIGTPKKHRARKQIKTKNLRELSSDGFISKSRGLPPFVS
ncbi:MAG: hypothetical protein LBR80_11185 [Deltaproteobacteria bacterium]|jgi:hypothetical protein|nr:hypothetical protein [Deltaproteobacteria bacterium]